MLARVKPHFRGCFMSPGNILHIASFIMLSFLFCTEASAQTPCCGIIALDGSAACGSCPYGVGYGPGDIGYFKCARRTFAKTVALLGLVETFAAGREWLAMSESVSTNQARSDVHSPASAEIHLAVMCLRQHGFARTARVRMIPIAAVRRKESICSKSVST